MARVGAWTLRAAVAAVAAGGLLAGAGPAIAAGTSQAGATDYVVATSGGTPSARTLDAALAGTADVTRVRSLGHDLAVVTVRGSLAGARARAVGRALTATPAIASAAVDSRMTLQGAKPPGTTLDPLFPGQWDLWDSASTKRAGGYGVDAPRAWLRTTGSSDVVVAVLDTGYTRHPDLPWARFAPGYDFVTGGDGVLTGDGDGWDADARDPGDVCPDESDSGSSWHGTFVTGEIAAKRDSRGVAGEAPGITIEPIRVLGGCGGTESDTIAAIRWAIGAAVPGVPDADRNTRPADVISMSIGSPLAPGETCSAALQAAIDEAWAAGTTVVAAAGNDDAPVSTDSPASCAHVISVAATSRYGNRAYYSNYGTAALSPTIAAPGGTDAYPVWGDLWTSTGAFSQSGNTAAIGGYIGTSMAAPRVAAAVALLLSVHPTMTPDEVAARLTERSTRFPSTSTCTTVRCGAGIVNAGDLLGVHKRFVHVVSATITGTAKPGSRLTAHAGTWRPGAEATGYRWYRDGKPLSATSATYRLTRRDAGARITVRVTVSRSGYSSASAFSAGRRISS
ncbi:MAG: serine protease [Microbacteriaceae bacterium]|jgi:serine protease|nr:serine protease [Microbacteriaceae bacterium]